MAKIDVKQETPVDHGEIICFSIYSGPKADFGNGKSCIWVDVLDGGGKDILVKFKPFFENPEIKKVSFFFWYATLYFQSLQRRCLISISLLLQLFYALHTNLMNDLEA